MTACLNGCKTRTGDKRHPVQAVAPAVICQRCENRLSHWLETIPDLYTLLPWFVLPGSVDRNPDSKATKAAEAPAPMRLEVVDLLDNRRGRKWLGTEPTDDMRGVLGTLESWARMVRDEKRIDPPETRATVASEAGLLSRHLLWVAEQAWADELYADVKAVHRQLADAVGDYRPRPVGMCVAESADDVCGGPLMPDDVGVHCARCGDRWGHDDLRRLGLLIGEEA